MKKHIPLFLILIVVVFVSCDACDNPIEPEDIPPMIDNPLWPWTLNSYWEFDIWESTDGAEFEYYEKYRVVDVFGYEDNRVAEIEFTKYTEDTIFADFTLWWGNTETGLYEFAPYDVEFAPNPSPKLLFKFPAEDLDSFQTYSYDFVTPYTMFYFDAGVPPIIVPAGTFESCVGYQLHYQTGHELPVDNYYYFKPDTGYVRYERYEAGSLIKTRSLRDFALVPEPPNLE